MEPFVIPYPNGRGGWFTIGTTTKPSPDAPPLGAPELAAIGVGPNAIDGACPEGSTRGPHGECVESAVAAGGKKIGPPWGLLAAVAGAVVVAFGALAVYVRRSQENPTPPEEPWPFLPADWPPEYAQMVKDEGKEFFAAMTRPWAAHDAELDQAVEWVSRQIYEKVRYAEAHAEWDEFSEAWLERWERGETDAEIRQAIEGYAKALGRTAQNPHDFKRPPVTRAMPFGFEVFGETEAPAPDPNDPRRGAFRDVAAGEVVHCGKVLYEVTRKLGDHTVLAKRVGSTGKKWFELQHGRSDPTLVEIRVMGGSPETTAASPVVSTCHWQSVRPRSALRGRRAHGAGHR
jgi:hypothetical protein